MMHGTMNVKETLLITEIRGGHAQNRYTRDLNASNTQSAHNSGANNNLDKFQRILQVFQRCISGNYLSVRKNQEIQRRDSKSLHLS